MARAGAEGPNGTLRSIPSGREGVVEDCAATAVFLCSSMGAYINGTTINVDGGTNAAHGWIGTPSEGWSLTALNGQHRRTTLHRSAAPDRYARRTTIAPHCGPCALATTATRASGT